MLERLVDVLCCPVCAGALDAGEHALRCRAGHSFDVARQGYVNLLAGTGPTTGAGTADTADMVRSRCAFLDAGHYRPLTDAIVRHARRLAPTTATAGDDSRVVVDAGAGPGHHLAAVLDALPTARGLALDASKHAARRAGRAHPRAAAVVWDLWRPLPVRSASAALLLDVFAPRHGPEYRRILRPDGALVVVRPGPDHLAALVTGLDLLSVDVDKDERLERTLHPRFELQDREDVEFDLVLAADDVAHLVAMGPSARHVDPDELRRRIDALATPVRTTASVSLSVYQPA